MASLTLRRANWCLHISRSSRIFAVSFSTSLRSRDDASSRIRSQTSSSFRSHKHGAYNSNRASPRAFSSGACFQAAQAEAPASKPASTYTPPPKPTYSKSSTSPAKPSPATKDIPNTTASAAVTTADNLTSLTDGFSDQPSVLEDGDSQVDWARSFHGLSTAPFAKEAADALLEPIPFDDVEVKPDGIIYLPEIKYRRILNKAFGPGGWGLAPRGETLVTAKAVTREYALLAHGR